MLTTSTRQRFGESHRRYPEEKDQIWRKVFRMIDEGSISPTVYEKEYRGLQATPEALADIAARKVWGKAIIHLDKCPHVGNIRAAKL